MKFAKVLSVTTASLALAVTTACSTTTMDAPQTAAATSMATLERVPGDGPALWKVSDADTTIYMFGTIHLLPKDVQWQNAAITNALASSDSVVTELMPGAGETPEDQQMFMTRGMLGDGRNLREMMSTDQKTRYEAALAKLGLPPAAFDQFKPWMATVTLSIMPLIQAGYDPTAGVEKVVETMAGPDKQRVALETVEYQLGVFDGMPEETQLRYLMDTADEIDNIKDQIDSMVAEWVDGDADALAAIMNESLDDPIVAERLLYTRNKNWAKWIDARLDQPGTVFMAVGAGHLAGEKSVQDYLVQTNVAKRR